MQLVQPLLHAVERLHAAEADLAHGTHHGAALVDRHAVDDAAHARPQLLQVADLGPAAAHHVGQARVGDHVLGAPACGRAGRQAEELLVHGADVAHQPFMVGHRDRLVRVGQEHVEDGEGEGHAGHHVEQRRRLVGRAQQGDLALGIGQHHGHMAGHRAARARCFHVQQLAMADGVVPVAVRAGQGLGDGCMQQRLLRQAQPRHGLGRVASPHENAESVVGGDGHGHGRQWLG